MTRTTIAIVLMGLLALACSCADPPARPAREAPRETTPTPATSAPPPAPPAPDAQDVSFTTADGVSITGTLRPPVRSDEPIVLLVHQLGSSRAEWAPLIERLDRAPRIASLAIDLRGHGGSTSGPNGTTLSWQDLSNEQWAATAEDVAAAVRWIESDESRVWPSRILAVGSSIGSTAVIAAASRGTQISGVVAISPGRAYHGFDAITPSAQLAGRSFLALVAAEDLEGVETASALARITGGESSVIPGSAHGVALLEGGETMDRVESFVRSVLERAGG